VNWKKNYNCDKMNSWFSLTLHLYQMFSFLRISKVYLKSWLLVIFFLCYILRLRENWEHEKVWRHFSELKLSVPWFSVITVKVKAISAHRINLALQLCCNIQHRKLLCLVYIWLYQLLGNDGLKDFQNGS
jgi:hypothetical protein